MLKLRIQERLNALGQDRDWLEETTGIARSSMTNLLEGETKSIKWDELGKLHLALKCDPGPLINIRSNGETSLNIDRLTRKLKKSFYWLAKETGLSHQTVWRLRNKLTGYVSFDTLEKVFRTLDCSTGDLIEIVTVKTNGSTRCA